MERVSYCKFENLHGLHQVHCIHSTQVLVWEGPELLPLLGHLLFGLVFWSNFQPHGPFCDKMNISLLHFLHCGQHLLAYAFPQCNVQFHVLPSIIHQENWFYVWQAFREFVDAANQTACQFDGILQEGVSLLVFLLLSINNFQVNSPIGSWRAEGLSQHFDNIIKRFCRMFDSTPPLSCIANQKHGHTINSVLISNLLYSLVRLVWRTLEGSRSPLKRCKQLLKDPGITLHAATFAIRRSNCSADNVAISLQSSKISSFAHNFQTILPDVRFFALNLQNSQNFYWSG